MSIILLARFQLRAMRRFMKIVALTILVLLLLFDNRLDAAQTSPPLDNNYIITETITNNGKTYRMQRFTLECPFFHYSMGWSQSETVVRTFHLANRRDLQKYDSEPTTFGEGFYSFGTKRWTPVARITDNMLWLYDQQVEFKATRTYI